MAFCGNCGAKLTEGWEFCGACGTRADATTGVPTEPPAAASAPAAGWARTAGQVARGAGAITQAATLGGGAVALPWQTITSGQAIDAGGLAAAAAPSLLAIAPRPNLRFPAAGIAVTVVMDVGIALLSGGAVNVPMLAFRILSGLGTSALGMIAGRGGGALRSLTGAASIVYGVVQLVSLMAAAYAAIATPVTLLTLLPSIIAVLSGLVLSVSTAIAGFRR